MYFKYLMNSPKDYRGNVALVAMSGNDEIAYTQIEDPTDDMVPLTDQEISLVNDQIKIQWLTQRQRCQQKIDIKADDIRASYMFNGARTIDSEYHQVSTVLEQWESSGSPVDNVPEEIAIWATLNNRSVQWAANDVRQQVEEHRALLRAIRTLRLSGKAEMKVIDSEQLEDRLNYYLDEMEKLRCPVDYLTH